MPLVSLLFRSFRSVSIRCLISSVSSGNFVIVIISYISSQGHRQQPLQQQHGELCVIQVGLKGGAGDLNPVLARYMPVSILYFFGSILREYLGRSETGNMKVKLSCFLEDIDSLQIFFIYLFEKQRDSESTHMLPLHSSHIHSCSCGWGTQSVSPTQRKETSASQVVAESCSEHEIKPSNFHVGICLNW